MSNYQKTVDIDVGDPRFANHESRTFRFHFHDFENLPATRGHLEYSPQFPCFGHTWCFSIYPGGVDDSRDGMISVGITMEREDDDVQSFSSSDDDDDDDLYRARVGISFMVKDLDGTVRKKTSFTHIFTSVASSREKCNFMKRSKIIDPANNLLDDGTLTVDAVMESLEETNSPCRPFAPGNPFARNMAQLFLDEETADVLFAVQTQDNWGPTNFHAHRVVLMLCASNLAELCGSYDNLTPIPISNVEAPVFKLLLRYVYGGTISASDWKRYSKELIEASDLYGVVNLKLEAELMYSKYTRISAENVVDLLLYSDSKQCAYLKEVVMDYVVNNGSAVLKKVALSDVVPQSSTMFTDLLAAVARGQTQTPGYGDDGKYESLDTMRVGALRRKLYNQGLDVDGSRETLVARLRGGYAVTGDKKKTVVDASE